MFVIYSRGWVKDTSTRYDDQNVTPSDYTLYFFVDAEQNRQFNTYFYNKDKEEQEGESRGM